MLMEMYAWAWDLGLGCSNSKAHCNLGNIYHEEARGKYKWPRLWQETKGQDTKIQPYNIGANYSLETKNNLLRLSTHSDRGVPIHQSPSATSTPSSCGSGSSSQWYIINWAPHHLTHFILIAGLHHSSFMYNAIQHQLQRLQRLQLQRLQP